MQTRSIWAVMITISGKKTPPNKKKHGTPTALPWYGTPTGAPMALPRADVLPPRQQGHGRKEDAPASSAVFDPLPALVWSCILRLGGWGSGGPWATLVIPRHGTPRGTGGNQVSISCWLTFVNQFFVTMINDYSY